MNAPMDSMRSEGRKVSFVLDRSELEALSMRELSAVFSSLSTLEQVLCAMTCQPCLCNAAPKSNNGAGVIISRLHNDFCSLVGLVGDVAQHAHLKEDDTESAEERAYILLKQEADLGGDDFGSTALMAVEQMHAIGIAADKAAGIRPKRRAA